MSIKALILDLDHTLIRGNISYLFMKHLLKKGEISFLQLCIIIYYKIAYRIGLISLKCFHQAACRIFLKGKKQESLEEEGEKFVLNLLPSILRKPLLEKSQSFKKVILLSSSPIFLVEPIVKYCGFTKGGGTTYQTSGGLIEAIDRVIDGKEKESYVHAYCKEQNIALEDVTAYTDSIEDLPLLNSVGEVVCINPSWRLRKIAQKKQWKVLLVG